MNPFLFLLAASIITGICILACIIYIFTQIKESSRTVKLIDATFPDMNINIDKKDIKDFEDFYIRSTSEPRQTLGLFYSDDDVETLRRKYSPLKLPKGRYKV